MKLLGLRLCEHDSNISYFDGSKIHYFKSERSTQIKHHAYNNLEEFYALTKCPVILNTSLNIAGKPIAGKIADVQKFFKNSNLDAIIIGNTIEVKL